MAFWESYSPNQVDEIKDEWSKSELVTENTDWNEAEKIANSTNRGWEKVVDMDTATPESTEADESQEASEEDLEANSLEMFNWNKELAKNEADKIIKENLPDAIRHLDEEEQKKFARDIEEWVAESGVDLPIETIPENWMESINNYKKVAKNKDSLSAEQRKALDEAEDAAVKGMEKEAKEKVLAGIVSESSSPEEQINTEPTWTVPNQTEWNTSWPTTWGVEWWLD